MIQNKISILVAIGSMFLGTLYAQTFDPMLIKLSTNSHLNQFDNGTARYTAMGGSMGALGADPSAMTVNPAGLGVAISNNLSVTMNYGNFKNVGSTGNSSITREDSRFIINQVGGVLSFELYDDKWKYVNLGFNAHIQNLDSYTVLPSNENQSINDLFFEEGDLGYGYTLGGYYERVEGSKSNVSIGVGSNYDNKLYLGANFNFHSSNYSSRETLALQSVDDDNIYYQDALDTPYELFSSGFSFGIGGIYKINHNFRIGAAYNTPTWWRYNELNSIYHDFDTSSSVPNDLLSSEWYFYDQDDYNTAGKVALSAAAVVGSNFAINVDFINYFMGDTKFKTDDFFRDSVIDFQGTNDFVNEFFKDVQEIRVGAEYRYNDFSFRGGWGTTSSPISDISVLNPNGTSVNVNHLYAGKKNKFSFGLGYDFGNFFVDLAYQNINQEFTMIAPAGFYADTVYDVVIDTDNSVVGTVENKVNNYFLTFGWNF